MRAMFTTLIVALGVVLACDEAPSPPLAPRADYVPSGDLIALLPPSTVVAVEVRNLAGRWDELRAIPGLAGLQDRLLEKLGLDADDVPELAGERAVIAVVADGDARSLVPVAVLDPPSPEGALAFLGRANGLVAHEGRGAVWVGPTGRAGLVERIAAGNGTSLRQAVDFAALAERLPEGGLARAVVHPCALREHLGMWAEMRGSDAAGMLAALFRSDLEAVKVAGFRRDIVDGAIVTDAWVGFDTEVVPEAFTRALATPRGPAVLPADIPADVLLASSFRTEAEAGLAWLRTVAARDPRGPLRNFDFWVDEFEARTGRDVERDIVGALGERGLAFLFVGEDEGAIEFIAIFDAGDPARLEASLVDLRDWIAEQVWGRSLGLAMPRSWNAHEDNGAVYGLDLRSPFATLSGPVFQLANDHLVVATSRRSLRRGVLLVEGAESWNTPAWALGEQGPPDEIVLIRTTVLARVLAAGAVRYAGDDGWFLDAVGEFLDGAGDGHLRVRYEEGGLRVSSSLRIDAQRAGP
ncbi:MAG: hypothetical protein JSV86_04795 [Gemmatimonadota bacterium]|nr:MAG: hypothetical protein JSV86_04795 [Gemmatimonadota bacterium]